MTLNRKYILPVLVLTVVTLITLDTGALPLPTVKQPIEPIETDGGLVAGKVLDSGVRAWFGVPYAAAPVRDLRWRPPQPLQWEGVYNADRFQPKCMQSMRGSNINHYFGHEAISEDCLYLNVWAPPDSEAGDKHPIIVWIYGGAFSVGSAAMRNYSGEGLAQKGAVYVSVSYRVGALGFLAHPELTAESPHKASGNYGLLDQVAALEWVQRNIDKFGGDPERVTIVGQSAGSMSASSLQVSPLAKNLFHGIIGMSGSSFGLGLFQITLEQSEKTGLEYEKALGVDSLAELRHVPADRILAHQIECRFDCAGQVGTIVDGYFLPDTPTEIFARGEQLDVPVMIGFTRDEGFSPIGRARTLEQYRDVLSQAYGDKSDELMQLYPASNDTEAWRAARDIARDSTMGEMMRIWGDLQSKKGTQPVFAFLFSRVQPYTPGVTFADHDPATVGAYHTGDVPYWLQTLDAFNLFRETRTYTRYDRELSELMSDAIIAFAQQGNPSTKSLDWPSFSPEDDRMVEFGRETDDLFRTVPWPNADALYFFKNNKAGPVVLTRGRTGSRD